MSKIDLEELERLAAQATPGPWMVTGKAFPEYVTDTNPNRKIARILRTPKACEENARYIVAACNAAPSLIARVRGQELINSHLRNQVEGLEELTDDLRANEHELTKQLDFVANCLAQSEKCFMPKEFSCSYRTPYGLYCHAEKAIRLNCIYCRAEEAAKEAE